MTMKTKPFRIGSTLKIKRPHCLDLHSYISDGFVKTKVFDKRDGFDFDIVN